jgi:hypothetical protein
VTGHSTPAFFSVIQEFRNRDVGVDHPRNDRSQGRKPLLQSGGILRFRPSRSEVPAVKSPRSTSIPKTMQGTYDAVVALTDTFCRENLNDEYRDFARAMTAALCRKRPSPLASGQPRTWACGIMYALGQLNFPSDKTTQPCMAMTDVCAAFGVGQSTASGKARAVSNALHTHRMDHR